jgi:hypothetical protein
MIDHDELHNMVIGLQQKLGWVLDILLTFTIQAHGINAPFGMAGPYGYIMACSNGRRPPMGAPSCALDAGGRSFATQPFGATMNPAPEMEAPSVHNPPTPPAPLSEPNPVAAWPLRLENNLSLSNIDAPR